ncbi:hypothetical protein Fmac_032274 [Flemingia macrophylla]|uniref:Uncharacterized protein n=1 Tax=Flemingia macrophylla TaxID=520843 RepID=A0ABD1L4X3_9FABA
MDVSFWVAWSCDDFYYYCWMRTGTFSISRTENKFRTVGCDGLGYLTGSYDNDKFATGCATQCDGEEFKFDNGKCSDINECKSPDMNICISEQHCRNTDGSYICVCPEGQSGNATEGEGCYHKNAVTKVVIGVATGIVTLVVGTVSLYLIYQKRKLNKLREKYFKQNGGSILLQQLSTRENSPQMTQIFTEEQLKKATNDFDESLIIGSGGFGTVFKGFLENNRIVAIKKSKIVDESQKEQFINEVIVLSQINHRNVVKLLGCCLEREVPLLVYEFVENGTVFYFLHTQKKVNSETWKSRLRIAAEAAGALSYLHSAASVPIIHRDDHLFDILQVGMVNEENEKEIIEVAILAARCLRLNGEERPSMKKVATELDAIRQSENHPEEIIIVANPILNKLGSYNAFIFIFLEYLQIRREVDSLRGVHYSFVRQPDLREEGEEKRKFLRRGVKVFRSSRNSSINLRSSSLRYGETGSFIYEYGGARVVRAIPKSL